MPLVFKESSIKGAFFWRFFLKNCVQIELTGFKSLFLVKFQASTLDQNHHLLVKVSCESACENLDAISARSAVCFVQPILQLSKKSSLPPL